MVETRYHFSRIARKYKDLRSTDLPPVKFIKNRLPDLPTIRAADVGCGVGRYDIELVRYLGPDRLSLYCIDCNRKMLGELALNAGRRGLGNCRAIEADAGALPLASGSLDTVFSFNAVHHFDLVRFLGEVARTLRHGRQLFVYTRFRSQNAKSLWGRFFPKFTEKEARLRELPEIQTAVADVPGLELTSVAYFRYRRHATLDWLETQAIHRHYSTFSLYKNGEFEEALKGFRRSILREFPQTSNIRWDDFNTMLVFETSAQRVMGED